MSPLSEKNKPVPMSALRRVKNHSRYHSICMLPCHSRSNKRYAFTQQLRRKLLAPAGVCLLSSEGISVRLHPPAFTIRRLSVGYKSLAVFVTAFDVIVNILCFSVPIVKPVFLPNSACIVLSVYSARFALTKQCGTCYLFTHIKCDDDVTQSSPFSESRRLV